MNTPADVFAARLEAAADRLGRLAARIRPTLDELRDEEAEIVADLMRLDNTRGVSPDTDRVFRERREILRQQLEATRRRIAEREAG